MRKYCTYETSLALKAHGYDEPCELYYTTAIRHNGVVLSLDDELDLKSEGRGDEIEYVHGGYIGHAYNTSTQGWLGEFDCSCPYIQDVLDWMMKEGFYVAVDFYCDYDEYPPTGEKFYHEPTWDWKIKRLSDGTTFLEDVYGILYGDKETAEEAAIRAYLKKLEEDKKLC